MLSPCGVDCSSCNNFQESCAGCPQHEGRVFWASFVGGTLCPIYDCAINSKGLSSCAQCSELPCRLYYDTRDPATTVEEHEIGVAQRVARLRAG